MRQEPISFGPSQGDGEELGGASPVAMNVLVDSVGAIRRRPGIQAYPVAPSSAIDANGIVALHETVSGDLYAVGEHPTQKPVYRVSGGSFFDVSAAAKVNGTGRPTIAETEAMLVFAAGEPPTKLVFSAGATAPLGGSPPRASHVVANSSRLLANSADARGTLLYSGPALGSDITGHETWSGLTTGSFQAEARPDPVLAVHENTSEVFGFGRTSLQYFTPDPQVAYVPVSTTEHGIAAAYSVIKSDQAFAWLDHQRRFVFGDGRSLQVISKPIQQELANMTTVSDCYGYRFSSGPMECFVWTFPTDGRTFVYQVGGGWSQWGLDGSGGAWQPFPVLSHFQRAEGAENLVGLRSGRVAVLRNGVSDDLGTPITASVTSGFQNRGTFARKHTVALNIALRRGETPATPGVVGLLRWRDDLGGWSDSRPVYVGNPGDSNPVLEFRSLGTYRMRQWQFEFSPTVTYSLVGVTETYTVE